MEGRPIASQDIKLRALEHTGADVPQDISPKGEMTGTVWIEEAGSLLLPVTITNTHAVGIAQEATIAWTTERHPQLTGVWALPVAAETWDGYLNDINGRHVTSDVVSSEKRSVRWRDGRSRAPRPASSSEPGTEASSSPGA